MPGRLARTLCLLCLSLILSTCARSPDVGKGLLADECPDGGQSSASLMTAGEATAEVSGSDRSREKDTALAPAAAIVGDTVLTPVQVYDQVSPSIAFIETPTGTGSGVLLDDGYVVTNAHVVWPFESARVVFADGSEFDPAPVINSDLMVDLAVIGPLDTTLPPLSLADGESLPVGSDVALVGYPGEVELFPQPAITRGLICRRREWEKGEITYYQTDATVAGGQSGGALVAADGALIGISGFSYADTFGLVASTADLAPLIASLAEGEKPAGIGNRDVDLVGGRGRQTAILESLWDVQMYVINERAGITVDLDATGTGDVFLVLLDPAGEVLSITDDRAFGTESVSFDVEWSAPYYVVVAQNGEESARYRLTCSHPLVPYVDPDDGNYVQVGETVAGSIDYPWDSDYYLISLEEGQTISVLVDSVMMDPYLTIDYVGAFSGDMAWDDDSGGGVFGLNATLEYTAPHAGQFMIVVEDSAAYEFGGYLLTVDEVG